MRVDAKTEKIKKIQSPREPKAKNANIQPWYFTSSRKKRALGGAFNSSSIAVQPKINLVKFHRQLRITRQAYVLYSCPHTRLGG